MDIPEKNCPELTQKTADAIDDITIHQLFVSTQINNFDLCVKSALQCTHLRCHFQTLTIFRHILVDNFPWDHVVIMVLTKFPHFWV